jgi:NAD(P)H-flavin reductase
MDDISYVPRLAQVKDTWQEGDSTVLSLALGNDRPLGHKPGQFVQISVFGYGEAPISVCSSPTRSDRFELCVQPVGNVSRAIQNLEIDDWVGIRGPYGHGYFPLKTMKGNDVLLIAGGIGLAPMRSLIDYIWDNREDYGRFVTICGAKTPSEILFRDEVDEWADDSDMELYVTVDEPDDAWAGRTGVVTDPLKEIDIDPYATIAAACGPPVMFRFIAMGLKNKGMDPSRIYFSLERRFKCGIGKCGHCQLNDLYVCQNGPVFRYAELLSRPEAGETWAPEKDAD